MYKLLFNKYLAIVVVYMLLSSKILGQIPVANLKLWVKADSAEVTGNFVSKLYDLSGNNYHFTQPQANRQPTLTPNAYGTLPTISFDGLNDCMIVDFGATMNQPATIFVVWKKNISLRQHIFDGIDETNRMKLWYVYNVGEQLAMWSGTTNNGIYYVKPITSNITVSSLVFATTPKMFDNGILKVSGGKIGSMGSNGFTIGANNTKIQCLKGDIAEFIVYDTELSDDKRKTVESYLMDKYAPPVSLGPDLVIEYGFCPTEISAPSGYSNIQWSNGSTEQQITVSQSGEYWVQATDIFGRVSSDTINITFTTAQPKIEAQSINLCLGSQYKFTTGVFNSSNSYTVKWFNDFEGDTLTISDYQGQIWATITDSVSCSSRTDTISVDIDHFSDTFTLGPDTTLCSGNTISILNNPLSEQISAVRWSNGSADLSIAITASGEYGIEVENTNGCIARDTIYVTVSGIAPTVDFDITGNCRASEIIFTNHTTSSLSDPISSYQWSFGDGTSSAEENPRHTYQSAASYTIKLEAYAVSGCSNNTTKSLNIRDLPIAYFPDDTACLSNAYYFHDNSTPQPSTTIETWLWNFGNGEPSNLQNPIFTFNNSGNKEVSLTITDNYGCQSEHTGTITVVEQMEQPGQFTTVSPPAYYISDLNTIIFEWNRSKKANYYRIEIATDPDFQNIYFQETIFSETATTTLPNGNYYWRIAALNYCNSATYSNSNKLRIGAISLYSGLVASYNASHNVVYDLDSLINSWGDNSGQGHSALQDENDKKPKFESNAINGKPAIKFAHNQSVTYLKTDTIDLSNTSYTIFAVIKPELFNKHIHYFVSGGKPNNDYGGLFSGGTLIKGIGAFDGSNTIRAAENNPNWQIAVFQNDNIRVNGSEITYGANATLSGMKINNIGTRDKNIDNHYFNGYIADLLIFNSKLTITETNEIEDYLRFKYYPPVSLGKDTSLHCGACLLTLSAPDFYSDYLWSTGEKTQTVSVSQTGDYWIEVTDMFGYKSRDTIFVECPKQSCYPLVELGPDIVIACGTCQTELSAQAPHFTTYLWSNGAATSSIIASETGYYYVTATDIDGYISVDSVHVTCPTKSCDPGVDLGNDIEIEYGFCPVSLDAGNIYSEYKWSTGENSQTITVAQTGYYSVTVTDQYNYNSVDSIYVKYPAINLSDTAICAGTTAILNTGLGSDYQYFWSTSSTAQTITVSQPQNVWVLITDSVGCQHTTPQVAVLIDSTSLQNIFAPDTAYLCSGNSLYATLPNSWQYSYLWNTGAESQYIAIMETGDYKVTVTSVNQCVVSDSINISITGLAPHAIFNVETHCIGDTMKINESSITPDGSTITMRNWRLSNGQTFTGEMPKFAISDTGLHKLYLEVITENGCSDSDSVEFMVQPITDFTILAPQYGCVDRPVTFFTQTNDTTPILWTWNFGDNTTLYQANTIHTYQKTGNYTVTLTAQTIEGCKYSKTTEIQIVDLADENTNIELLTPEDNEYVTTPSVMFSWRTTNSNQFSHHTIEISGSPDFNTLVHTQTTTEQSVMFKTATAGTYYWRIISYTFCNDSITTQHRSFTIFTPSIFENLKLWVRADSSENTNGLVSQLYDLSGNNHHLVQSETDRQPSYQANAYNSLPTISFDGANDCMTVDFGSKINQPATIFVVWKKNVSLRQHIFDGIEESNRMKFWYVYNVGEQLAIWSGTNNNGIYYTKPITPDITVSSLIFSHTPAIFDNGQETVTGGNIGNQGITGITLGANYQRQQCLNGDIAELILYNSELTQEDRQLVENYLMNRYSPPISLGPDIVVDYGFCSQKLEIGSTYRKILWSTGDTTNQITIYNSGEYWVQGTDIFGRISTDTINVTLRTPQMPNDFEFCEGTEHQITLTTADNYKILWSNGDTTNTTTINQSGDYWIRITDTLGCFIQKEFTATANYFATTATLGNDKTMCNGSRLTLEQGTEEAVSYLWSDGSTQPWMTINNHNQVSVTVTNNLGCTAYDTIGIEISGSAPIIAFNHTPMCKDSTFVFNNLSQTIDGSTITSSLWIFNQTDTIIGNTAQYRHNKAETLQINLQVNTNNGCSSDTTFTAKINDLPNTIFTPLSSCERTAVTFRSISTISEGEITNWTWDINGNLFTTETVNYTFATAGDYEVSLTTTSDKGCTSTRTVEYRVKNSPKADFSFENSCEGLPVLFVNQSHGWMGSSLDYVWHFGTQTQMTQISPTYTFNSIGSFNVKLVATQHINLCRDTIEKKVTVYPNPTALIGEIATCSRTSVVLTDSSQAGYGQAIISKIWKTDPHAGIINESVLQTLDTSGTFNIRLTVTNSGGCKSKAESTLTVHKTPKAHITTQSDTVYIPKQITLTPRDTSPNESYKWYLNQLPAGSQTTLTHNITGEGYYDFGLAIETNRGCYDSTSKVITALRPDIDIEIKSVSSVLTGDQILIRPVLRNNGNVPMSQFVLHATFDNQPDFSEIFESTLDPGTEQGYTLRTRLSTNPNNLPTYVCVEALTTMDKVVENNRKCHLFDDKTRIFPPQPNPAFEEIKFDVISDLESLGEITIISSGGTLLWRGEYEIVTGLNRITIPVPSQATDIIYLKVKVNTKQLISKIMIIRQ